MRKVILPLVIVLLVTIPAFVFFYFRPDSTVAFELTAEERAYLHAVSPVRMAVDPDWEPFVKIDEKGNYSGIAADYIRLIEKRLGLAFELVPTESWAQTLDYSREGRVTIVPFLNKNAKREQWLTFTEPLVVDDNAIIGRYDKPYIRDLGQEPPRTVALPAGTTIEERLRRDYPNLAIRLTDSEREAFELVSAGEADLTIQSVLVGAYFIRMQGWFDLKVIGKVPGYTNYLGIGVAKNREMLRAILDKAILSITEQEDVDILNRRVPLRVEMPDSGREIVRILIATIVLASAFLVFSIIQSARAKKMRKRNEEIQTITARYEALSELAGTFFWQIDRSGSYTYVSSEVRKVLGFEPKELLGTVCGLLPLLEAQADALLQNCESKETRKDGSSFWVRINAIPLLDAGNAVIGYRGSSTDIEKRKQLEQALVRAKDEIELAYYQAQIAPHFLYNALSAIAMYCATEPHKASKLIMDLSFFLRRSFDFKSIRSLVPFEEELELIETYFRIEQARFGDRISLAYDLEGVPRKQPIPSLILQPLIENAINHGIVKRLEGGTLTLKAALQGDKIKFEVIDDGVGIPEQQIRRLQTVSKLLLRCESDPDIQEPDFDRHGVGLKNIHARLIKLYRSELVVTRNESGGTTVAFEIPARLKETPA